MRGFITILLAGFLLVGCARKEDVQEKGHVPRYFCQEHVHVHLLHYAFLH